jgi:hypothetical protein
MSLKGSLYPHFYYIVSTAYECQSKVYPVGKPRAKFQRGLFLDRINLRINSANKGG